MLRELRRRSRDKGHRRRNAEQTAIVINGHPAEHERPPLDQTMHIVTDSGADHDIISSTGRSPLEETTPNFSVPFGHPQDAATGPLDEEFAGGDVPKADGFLE